MYFNIGLKRSENLKRTGQIQKALENYDKSLEKAPGDFGLLLHKSLLLNHIGKHSEALEILQAANPSDNKKNIAGAFKGMFFLDDGQLDKAQRHLQAVIESHAGAKLAKSFLLLVLLQQEDYVQASEIIREINIPDSPYFKIRLFLLMEKQFLSDSKTVSAKQIQAVEKKVEEFSGPCRLSKIWCAGVEAYDKGEEMEALYNFLLGHREFPKKLEFVIGLAEVYSLLGREQQSEDYFNRIKEFVEPTSSKSEAHGILQRILVWLKRDNEEDRTWSRYYYGKHLTRTGRAEEAVKIFEELLKINSNNVECYLELGITYIVLGDDIQARKNLARNLEVDADTFALRLQRYLKQFCNIELNT
ncbi:tetratricopeptide repeat protein [Planctomycetota bacterium]